MTKLTTKQMILTAPDDHIASSLMSMVETFQDEPTPEELLQLLDKAVLIGGASSLGMALMETLLQRALNREGRTYEDVIMIANETWRKQVE